MVVHPLIFGDLVGDIMMYKIFFQFKVILTCILDMSTEKTAYRIIFVMCYFCLLYQLTISASLKHCQTCLCFCLRKIKEFFSTDDWSEILRRENKVG